MNEKLTLNDGTEIAGHMYEIDGRLFVYMSGITLAEAFSLLIDPEKTKKITENRYGEITTITGYNHLYAISEESESMISAVLKKN